MIKRINDYLYSCDSRSEPKHPHYLWFEKENNRWYCDCKGYAYREICRHYTELVEGFKKQT